MIVVEQESSRRSRAVGSSSLLSHSETNVPVRLLLYLLASSVSMSRHLPRRWCRSPILPPPSYNNVRENNTDYDELVSLSWVWRSAMTASTLRAMAS
mmetsp:Transcript_17723/g.54086  ORF Transcript_17723/g.54086 Transcript_17723/m.54086 type:complete len:97 (+) Transcript_17723:1945-2235(+)